MSRPLSFTLPSLLCVPFDVDRICWLRSLALSLSRTVCFLLFSFFFFGSLYCLCNCQQFSLPVSEEVFAHNWRFTWLPHVCACLCGCVLVCCVFALAQLTWTVYTVRARFSVLLHICCHFQLFLRLLTASRLAW